MRTLPLAVALVLAASVGSPAAAATRTYSVTGFEKIRVEGPYAVTLKVGTGASAVANGDMRAIDRLKVEVQNRTLIVRTDRQAWGGSGTDGPGRVALSVTTPTLTSALLAGSGSIAIDRAKAQRFDMAVSGSGSASIDALETDRAFLSLVGTGELTVGGKASQTRASLQGSGTIEATKLAVDDLDVAVAGSGDATFAARRTAKVSSTGSGDVTVTGAAACTIASAGSGEVRCGR
jgi:hypothetical protein